MVISTCAQVTICSQTETTDVCYTNHNVNTIAQDCSQGYCKEDHHVYLTLGRTRHSCFLISYGCCRGLYSQVLCSDFMCCRQWQTLCFVYRACYTCTCHSVCTLHVTHAHTHIYIHVYTYVCVHITSAIPCKGKIMLYNGYKHYNGTLCQTARSLSKTKHKQQVLKRSAALASLLTKVLVQA